MPLAASMELPSPVRFTEFELCLIHDSLVHTPGSTDLSQLVAEALTLLTAYQHTPSPQLSLSFSNPERDRLVCSLDKLISDDDYFSDVKEYKSCLALRERLALN